jgi:hypothetical protein
VSDQEKKPKENEEQDGKDVEGHLLNTTDPSSTDVSEPDVEGHMYEPSQTDVSQTDVS